MRSNQDHEKIFEAIIKKDLELSQDLLEEHIRRIIHGLEGRSFTS
jgi:DNA-binding GntR family transcriptional regulator